MGSPPNLLFAPDSRTLAVGGNDQMLHIFETATGKELHLIKGYMQMGGNMNGTDQGLGTTVAFSTDGKTVAMTAGTVIRRWSVTTGKELPLPGAGHECGVLTVAVSPDGKTIVTSGTQGMLFWDATTGQMRRRVPEPVKPSDDGPAPEEPSPVNALTFTPDGKALAVGEQDGTIRLYDPASGKEIRQLTGHESGITHLKFVPTGKLLLSAAYDGRMFVWDVAAGKQLRQFAGPVPGSEFNPENPVRGSVSFFALAPDGATLATSGDNGIRVCELATGKVRRQLTKVAAVNDANYRYSNWVGINRFLDSVAVVSDSGNGLTFSPDGRTLATISGSTVYLWDTARGKELRQLGGQGNSVRSVAFTPDGKIIAASSEDGTIRFWDTATGTILAQVEGHRGGVGSIVFSADGQTLTSAGNDTTSLVWDVKRCLEGGVRRAKPTAQTVSKLWDRLADDDAEKAGEAMTDLAEHPDLALPVLRDRLVPVPPVNKPRLTKLVANLEDDSFDVRKKANEELEKMAELAEPALQARLADNPALEVKQRIERLLEKLRGPVAVAEQARALRALELLETIGGPEARSLLEKMAKGTPESRVTQRAKERLELWQKNGSGQP
jgi:WD40 repeat protein